MGIISSSIRPALRIHSVVDRGSILPWVGAVAADSPLLDAARRARSAVVQVPVDATARRRFVRDWLARNRRAMAAGLGGMVLLLPMLAQAQTTVEPVAGKGLPGLVSAVLQPDGSVLLTFADGRVVSVPADQVTVMADGRFALADGVLEALGGGAGEGASSPGLLAAGGGLVLAAGLGGGGGGGGGGGHAPAPVQLVPVVDGYLVDAFVFRDLNANGIWDSGEAYTVSDQTGNFDINLLTGAGSLIAGTPNDAAIAQDSTLAGLQPIDISTGAPFTGTLSAPDGATVITPLTTLVNALMQNDPGLTAQEAAAQVAGAFGLTGNLLADDPVALAEAGGSGSLAQLQAAAQVAAIINLTTAAGGNSTAAMEALAQQITDSAGGAVSLSDPDVLAAVTAASGADDDTALAGILAAVNSALQDTADLAGIEQVQSAVQGAIVDAVAAGETVDVQSAITNTTALRPVIETFPTLVNVEGVEAGIEIAGSGRPGSVVTVTFGGLTSDATVDGDGNWSVIFSQAPADGEQTLSAIARLGDGPASPASQPLTVTVDTTAPVAPTLVLVEDTGAQDGVTANGAVSVTGTETGALVEYSIDGGTTWTTSFTATQGTNAVQVRQTDVAGNTSPPSAPLVFTLLADPTGPVPATIAVTGVVSLPDLVSQTVFGDSTIDGTPTATGVTLVSASGQLELTVTGTGLVWTPGDDGPMLDGGTITGLTFRSLSSGTMQTVLDIAGLSIDAADLSAASDIGDEAGVAAFWALFDPYSFTIIGSDGDDEPDLGPLKAGSEAYAMGAGDDFILGSAGNDTIDGGDGGFDQVAYHRLGLTGGITVTLADDGSDGIAQTNAGNALQFTDILRNIEVLRGTEGDDSLTGNSGNNSFRGLAGDDTINGGDGFDQVRYDRDANEGGMAGVFVDLGAGTAIDGFGDTDTLISIEAVLGTAFNDTLRGSDGDNHLNGGAGDDILDGGAGNDTLTGGAGRDTFILSGGHDVITDFSFADDTIETGFSDTELATLVGAAQSVTVNGQPAVRLNISQDQSVTFEGFTVEAFQQAFASFAEGQPLLDAIAQAGTLSAMETALAAFADARSIDIPDGMLPDLAGDLLLALPASYSLTFTVNVVDSTGTLADSPPATITGTMTFRLPFDGAEDQLSEASQPVAVFQYAQSDIPGNTLDYGISLRLSQTNLRLESDEITQDDIDELGQGGIAAIFGPDAVITPGTYTAFQLWLSSAVAGQDPVTGDFNGLDGLEASINLFLPGQVGLEAFLDALVSGTLPLAQFQVQDYKPGLPDGEETQGGIVGGFSSFTVTRTAGEVSEADLIAGINGLIDLRLAIDAVLDAANSGTLSTADLAELLDATPSDEGAAPFLAGELLSVAAVEALQDLASLPPGQLVPLLAAFNADPTRPSDLASLTDLMTSPILFPALNGAAGSVVFGTDGDDMLGFVAGLAPEDGDTLFLPGAGEDQINLTNAPGASTILYQAGLVGGVDNIIGFDTAQDRIGYVIAEGQTASLAKVSAVSTAEEDMFAALGDYVFGGSDIQFVLIDPAGGDGPLLVALTAPLAENDSPDGLATLQGIDPGAFTLQNLVLLPSPPEV